MDISIIERSLNDHRYNKSLPSFKDSNQPKPCRCGKHIIFNGISSHSTVCNFAYDLLIDFYKEKYIIYDNCPICNADIKIILNRTGISTFIFCSQDCRREAEKTLTAYNNIKYNSCVICNTLIKTTIKNDRKTCSDKCLNEVRRTISASWHEVASRDTPELYKARNKKISESTMGRVYVPWNKNLKGEEYLSHYDKSDGSNSLYDAIQNNNSFFKKTNPEILFETKLKEWGCRYQYSFFTQNRQFDFLVSTNNFCFIIEIDGDYWHKSRRLNFSEDVIQTQRILDKEKEKVIENLTSHKQFILLRVWEYHIVNDIIWSTFNDIFMEKNISENISKIKEYYSIFY